MFSWYTTVVPNVALTFKNSLLHISAVATTSPRSKDADPETRRCGERR